ncbi:M24 family metallopeptidase [Candidatus Tisiphia endosymbiont of Nemotelus uliginosus]|uniref:M24 family metallopeptidase n=1 Tax=Candidatus Tisiphia endosymbiont of Nemotelus uliginosus TaxID=3077926 RepID=UPI0035C8E795
MHAPIGNIIALFDHYQISAYIVPSNDQYFSEYPPAGGQRLKYLTNFSGSNGIAIICQDKGLFFTDGRYLEQSKLELDQSFFYIFDINNLLAFPWDNYLDKKAILGYDPRLFTNSKLTIFAKIVPCLLKITDNLVDKIWIDKPAPPISSIYAHDIEFAGQAYSDKIAEARNLLIQHYAIALIITTLDSICWLLNLRANDISYSPLLLGKVIITVDSLFVFTNLTKVSKDIMLARPDITFCAEENFEIILHNQDGKILFDESTTSIYVKELLNNKITEKVSDPCQLLKACKNNVEITHAVNCHIQDAVALCEFFAYLFTLPSDLLGKQTEYSLGEILTGFRAKQTHYIMDSFPTICGFKEHGAIIHYRASLSQAKQIVGNGLLLIDSGGQYKGGTTDVTRTFAIGKPTIEQKLRYTQVLKGHIALSKIKFPNNNVTGSNLDVLARQFLWQDFQDYPHGTGHGVGSFLNVHEGPHGISLRNNIFLKPGMIVSNEPGYYKVGDFGIRIENLMYIKEYFPYSRDISGSANALEIVGSNLPAQGKESANYLEFDTLTLVPYAKELIELKMLSNDEKDYIKQYYNKIKQQVYPLLSIKGKKWLDSQLFL